MIERRITSCLLLLSSVAWGKATDVSNIFLRSQQVASEECSQDVDSLYHQVNELPFVGGGSIMEESVDIPMSSSLTTNENASCNPQELDAPGIWYKVTGHNRFVRAALDSSSSDAAQKVALFQGSPCQPQECIFARNNQDHRQLNWFANEGATYFFKVFDDSLTNTQESQKDGGVFFLQMDEFTVDRPENDQCATAKTLKSGQVIEGVTNGAWPHGLTNEECRLQSHSRGLFYNIEGTGSPISIALRPDAGVGYMEVAVLSDCGTSCITTSNFLNALDATHSIKFDSAIGETYTIVISGQDVSDTGVFQLTVNEEALQDQEEVSTTSGAYSVAQCALLSSLLSSVAMSFLVG